MGGRMGVAVPRQGQLRARGGRDSDMVIKREPFKVVKPQEYLDREARGECPVCGKPKAEWKPNRRRYGICSHECKTEFWEHAMWGEAGMKSKALVRDDHKCRKCGVHVYGGSNSIMDHIVPIALGGPQWDLANVQTLCEDCNAVKTRMDARDIARARRQEKVDAYLAARRENQRTLA